MGGQQSTRKLTINNDNPTDVIQVSESVVQRLKGAQEQGLRNPIGHSPPPVQAAPLPGSYVNPPPPAPYYYYEPSLTAIQVRLQKEEEIKKNDQYWQKRLAQMEEHQRRIQTVLQKEYEKAVGDVNKEFRSAPVPTFPVPCQENKKAVMECYKKHPKEPLLCVQEVKAFAQCVDLKRSAVLAGNRG